MQWFGGAVQRCKFRTGGDNGDNSDNSDKSDSSDNSDNGDNGDNSENGDNRDSGDNNDNSDNSARLGCVLTNAMKTKGDIVLLHVFNLTITKEILEHLFHTLGVSNFLLLKTG